MARKIKVMGMDPGSVNYGYCVSHVGIDDNENFRWKLIEHGLMKNPIDDVSEKSNVLKDGTEVDVLINFIKEVETLLDEHKPTHLMIERYISRKFISKGINPEAITLMIGIVGTICHYRNINFRLVAAATWKGQVNKMFDLKKFYKRCKGSTPHQIDAVFIALYRGAKVLDAEFLLSQNKLVAAVLDTIKK